MWYYGRFVDLGPVTRRVLLDQTTGSPVESEAAAMTVATEMSAGSLRWAKSGVGLHGEAVPVEVTDGDGRVYGQADASF